MRDRDSCVPGFSHFLSARLKPFLTARKTSAKRSLSSKKVRQSMFLLQFNEQSILWEGRALIPVAHVPVEPIE